MTRERLERYRSEQEEIAELRYKHLLLDGDSLVGKSTILNYKSGYPVPETIVATDREKYYRMKEKYDKRREELEKECAEVEDWVEEIEDSLLRRIFRMRYIEGMRQEKVARTVHLSQSVVSRKISDFLKVE